MKSQPVEFLDFIEEDLRYAHAFYDSWQTDGAARFQQKFRETIEWIAWNPDLFPTKYKFYHRAIIRRSYFGVYFAVEPHVTTVVAVLDMRQDPRIVRQLLQKRRRPSDR